LLRVFSKLAQQLTTMRAPAAPRGSGTEGDVYDATVIHRAHGGST